MATTTTIGANGSGLLDEDETSVAARVAWLAECFKDDEYDNYSLALFIFLMSIMIVSILQLFDLAVSVCRSENRHFLPSSL